MRHADCFVCTKCHMTFDEYYWEYNGKPLCFEHYLHAAGFLCAGCEQTITVRYLCSLSTVCVCVFTHRLSQSPQPTQGLLNCLSLVIT